MRGISSLGFESRRGVSTRIIAGVVIIVIIVAAIAGYLALKPSSSSKSTASTATASSCSQGFCVSNPVSGVTLYNDYQLSGIPTNDKTFTGKIIYAQGNLTSIITYPSPQVSFNGSTEETGVFTNADDFEYWYWGNATGLPFIAANQLATAQCYVIGLAPYGNGSSFLYLDNCQLISLKT